MSTGWAKLDAPELVDILRNVARAFVAYDGSSVDTRDEVFGILERAGVTHTCPECEHMAISDEVCLECVQALPDHDACWNCKDTGNLPVLDHFCSTLCAGEYHNWGVE